MSAPGFWDEPEKAQEVGRKRSRVEKRIEASQSLDSKTSDLEVLLDFRKEGEAVDSEIEVGGLGRTFDLLSLRKPLIHWLLSCRLAQRPRGKLLDVLTLSRNGDNAA